MTFSWNVFIDLGIISAALLLATLLRSKVAFLRKYRVPNGVTAGFILLLFYNFAAPALGATTATAENLAFHLLGISFAAMGLRRQGKRPKGDVFPVAVVLLMQHILQAIVGLGLTVLFIATLWPGLFPGFGLLFPLGFALGPGQALAFASKWRGMGFPGAESVGLTFAALGFLFACFGGIVIIDVGQKRKWIKPEPEEGAFRASSGLVPEEGTRKIGMRLVSGSETIDTLSLNAAVVLAVYAVTYFLLRGAGVLFGLAGTMGRQFADSLWAITFVFSGLLAQVAKGLLKAGKADFILENDALTRISGFAVDYLVAASLGLISFAVLKDYWLQIAVVTLVGSAALIALHLRVCSRVFSRYGFYRMITVYGAMTGTIATGLALLRVVDPDFKTPVASDHLYAAGLMFPMAIPFILMADFPANYAASGNPLWISLTVAVLAVYSLLIAWALFRFVRRNGGVAWGAGE